MALLWWVGLKKFDPRTTLRHTVKWRLTDRLFSKCWMLQLIALSATNSFDRRLSWPLQMIAASCSTALGSLCGQLTFGLCGAMNTQQLRRQNLCSRWTSLVELSSGPDAQSLQTSPTDCSDDSWRDTFHGKHEHGALWLLMCGALEKHLLTYLRYTLYNSWLCACSLAPTLMCLVMHTVLSSSDNRMMMMMCTMHAALYSGCTLSVQRVCGWCEQT